METDNLRQPGISGSTYRVRVHTVRTLRVTVSCRPTRRPYSLTTRPSLLPSSRPLGVLTGPQKKRIRGNSDRFGMNPAGTRRGGTSRAPWYKCGRCGSAGGRPQHFDHEIFSALLFPGLTYISNPSGEPFQACHFGRGPAGLKARAPHCTTTIHLLVLQNISICVRQYS